MIRTKKGRKKTLFSKLSLSEHSSGAGVEVYQYLEIDLSRIA